MLAENLRHFSQADVCLDIDSIPPGIDWVNYIEQQVAECDVVIVMIGDDWLTLETEHGTRRIDDPDDPVRLEVKGALEREIPVIPALVEGATMPRPADLPDEIAVLPRRNAMRLRDDSWRADFHELAARLPSPSRPTGEPARVRSDRASLLRSPIALAGGALAVAAVVVVALLIAGVFSGSSGSSAMSCGDNLTVGPHTSCEFAQNVRTEYGKTSGGKQEVRAFSPVTGQSYAMRCAPVAGQVICKGDQSLPSPPSVSFPP